MNEPKEMEETVRGKRKIDCLTEVKEYNENKIKDQNKIKKRIEFENDDEFEKCLLSTFKKKDESEYLLSDILKNLYGEPKKYKTVRDMANEIKKIFIYCISNNLEIICNNECTSSFFIEKFRVKYINEQNNLNIRSAQNYFKEFMFLYRNSDFADFNLEINTNVSGKNIEEGKNDRQTRTGMKSLTEIDNKKEEIDISFLTEKIFFSSDKWKEKIKFKIQNINDHNVLYKIINYLQSVTVRIENVSSKLKKFDIVKALEDANMSILNINMWDVYLTKPDRSMDFFRKAMLYVQNKNDVTKLIHLLRNAVKTKECLFTIAPNPNKNRFNDDHKKHVMGNNNNKWKFEIKQNIYNYLEIRVCPPICSHKDIIAKDYENAKKIVKKLDKCCNISKSLIQNTEDELLGRDLTKRRKIEEPMGGDEEIKKKENEETEKELNGFEDQMKIENDGKKDNDNETDCFIVELLEGNKKFDISKKLDILILYLRFVHNFCFYSAKKFNTYDEMVRECGHFFLRVNLNKGQPHNLTPTYYENFDILKLICDDEETPDEMKNMLFSRCKKENGIYEKDINVGCNGDNSNIEEETNFSQYQLKWRKNFEKELADALEMNYYENIDIEKTEEFHQILKKKYAIHVDDDNKVRCAKCKKLFMSIKDLPNHILLKHLQTKLQLVTDTEIEIMKKKFFEEPHSFHFLHMMEKKYSSILQQNNHFKGYSQKRNKNIHFIGNGLKHEGGFDNRIYSNLAMPPISSPERENVDSKKKGDFYDDT